MQTYAMRKIRRAALVWMFGGSVNGLNSFTTICSATESMANDNNKAV
jgi:hypothetical protein